MQQQCEIRFCCTLTLLFPFKAPYSYNIANKARIPSTEIDDLDVLAHHGNHEVEKLQNLSVLLFDHFDAFI